MKKSQRERYHFLEIKQEPIKNFKGKHKTKQESSILGSEQFRVGRIIILLLFTLTLFNCSKDEDNNKLTTIPNLYVAGHDGSVATLWKNGTPTGLTTSNHAIAFLVFIQ